MMMQPTWFFSSLLALSVSVPLLAQAAETPALHAAFARPQQLVDIGGRKLNLYCSGAGATTVLFDAPSGEGGWSWFKVQPEVARHTRACVYDRAGLGFSDAAARPNTSANAVEDVHKALTAAGIKPPYLLVGNSLGGENVQVFTYRYPAEVKGLVLVEPQTEDQTARMDNITGGKITQFYAMVKQQDAWCLAEAAKGFTTGSEALANCIGDPDAVYGPVLGKAVKAIQARPSYWRVRADKFNALDASDAQLRALRAASKSLGDLPLLVLTRSVSPYAVPGQPQSAMNKATEAENEKIHREIAALSTRGRQRVIPGASHVIQAEQPAAVAQAVLEVLAQIR
jgi:pimeloyl-ACP methyl ester carboxylesterase